MEWRSMRWHDLPLEMSHECIKYLDFKSRMRLCAASSNDKSLVESAPKYRFDSVDIDLVRQFEPYVICKENGVETVKIERLTSRRSSAFRRKAFELALQIFQFSVFTNLKFYLNFDGGKKVRRLRSVIGSWETLRLTTLKLDIPDFKLVKAFIEKVESPDLEELEVDFEDFEEEIFELLEMEAVYRVPVFRMMSVKSIEGPVRLIKNWIARDAEVGKKLRCHFTRDGALERLAAEFENRIVLKTHAVVRLRTDNDSKHIRIHCVICTPNTQIPFFSTIVIPADRPEAECDADRQWVDAICEENHQNCLRLDAIEEEKKKKLKN